MIPRRCNQIGMASGKRGKKKNNKHFKRLSELLHPCWAMLGRLKAAKLPWDPSMQEYLAILHYPLAANTCLCAQFCPSRDQRNADFPSKQVTLGSHCGHSAIPEVHCKGHPSSFPLRGKGCQQLWPVWWRGKRSQGSHSQSLTESVLARWFINI